MLPGMLSVRASARLPRTGLFLVAGLVLLGSSTPSAEARCRQQGLAPRLLMPDGHVYARDGELVVALVSSGDPRNRGFPTDMRLEQEGAAPIRLRFVSMAPDLGRYKPLSPPGAGQWTLVNGGSTLPTTITFGTNRRARPPRPTLMQVNLRVTRRGRSPANTLHAQLDAPAPDGIVAGITRVNRGVVSRAHTVTGEVDVTLFGWRRRCRQWPDDLHEPPESGDAGLQWVTADGAVSTFSEALSY